jgi:CheY-specific phosphatase CheX
MSLSPDGIRDIVNAILSLQLGLELDVEAPPARAAGSSGGELMTGTIQVNGDWNGTVQVVVTLPLIQRVASIMFSLAVDSLSRADLRDALGELSNMAAGNLKALLGGDSHISLPTVVDGSDYDVTVLDSELLLSEIYGVGGEPLRVTVFRNRGRSH